MYFNLKTCMLVINQLFYWGIKGVLGNREASRTTANKSSGR